MTREEKVKYLLSNPDKLLMKRPFLRGGGDFSPRDRHDGADATTTASMVATLPTIHKNVVSQERFAMELDPQHHEVMFDDNLPSICVKLRSKGGRHGGGVHYQEVNYKRMGIALQERIRQKKTLTQCGNPLQHTLRGSNHSEQDLLNFATIKEAWVDRNQDGMITKAVYTQLGYGDVGLLYYRNEFGEIKSRLLSYADGYVIISHNDDNGERVMECVYYADSNGTRHIDCYDDTNIYHLTDTDGWNDTIPFEPHGFNEIPLVTKRGDVAWNDAQSLIEAFEILYNIYLVIQKRHGWGILYIRGKINETVKKLAGSIVLNDTSLDGNGSAEFKAPPSPQGVLDTLQSIYEQIQINSSCTFILPKDVKTSGDISAVAIMLTQQLDIEGATSRIIEWQNFIDKAMRLFAYGYAQELVQKGENPTAITDFAKLKISTKFKIWRPFSEEGYNQMLATMKNAAILSRKTAVEKNTIVQPDELQRIEQEEEEVRRLQEEQQARTAALAANINTNQANEE